MDIISPSTIKYGTIETYAAIVAAEAKKAELAKEFIKHIYAQSEQPSAVFSAAFETKAAENETLSDEFCNLVVDIFKGNIKADEFSKKMLEYIKEF